MMTIGMLSEHSHFAFSLSKNGKEKRTLDACNESNYAVNVSLCRQFCVLRYAKLIVNFKMENCEFLYFFMKTEGSNLSIFFH